ncbi:acyltransferase family protein [Hyunsoonleella sp. SJ7]|uniref:Acyltransferase family protein n=1 Tax=Hyunsoonleella aquatilis TaxID=2762758 RepID=A0A923H875_9FLAO|nr:acyltransferase family protein [Hyunsoonleella aquatilis]MBC3758080.1 acyltransferase family protein [Hyunsoonleella aquatilis]
MKTTLTKTRRIHSMDSLRAIMMLLGLVLHSVITYGTFDYKVWQIQDPNTTHLSNDYMVGLIHAFRMQIFFMVAGFFGAMLFYERTPIKMIKNRLERILYPFLVFVVLLWPTIVFGFAYTGRIFQGNANALEDTLSLFTNLGIYIPQSTFHLWFLYYLVLITAVSVLFGFIFKKLPIVSLRISNGFNWVIKRPLLRILVLASISALVYIIMGVSYVSTSISFVPEFNTFIYYFTFYSIGWVLYQSKHLLHVFMKHDWINTLFGVILFSVYFFMRSSIGYEGLIILKSVMVWFFIFGITGLFIRYTSNHSARMRYISDASYWVYLVHVTIVVMLPSYLVDWPVASTIKTLVVVISAGVISFASYHYLVRSTFIGKFLNGRRYSKKLSDIKKAEALTNLKPLLDN